MHMEIDLRVIANWNSEMLESWILGKRPVPLFQSSNNHECWKQEKRNRGIREKDCKWIKKNFLLFYPILQYSTAPFPEYMNDTKIFLRIEQLNNYRDAYLSILKRKLNI